jgi:hypothetical protein
MTPPPGIDHWHRSPAEIIGRASGSIMFQPRDVELILAKRGVVVPS